MPLCYRLPDSLEFPLFKLNESSETYSQETSLILR